MSLLLDVLAVVIVVAVVFGLAVKGPRYLMADCLSLIYTDPRVLAWVNSLREKYAIGAPLTYMPEGEPGTGYRCPVARALDAHYVSRHNASISAGTVRLPDYVAHAITDFDAAAQGAA